MPSAAAGGRHVRKLLGAYVLGGLSAREASQVAAHLRQCAQCRAEHSELACVPSWLDLLSASDEATGSDTTASDLEQNPDEPGGPHRQPC
jgi:anti-sigma factor ChrR (cupin superfamily)